MRITLRLIVALTVVVASVAFFSAYFQVRQEKGNQQEELERRSRLLAQSLQAVIEPLLEKGSSKNLRRILEKYEDSERLIGAAIYDSKGAPLAVTPGLAPVLQTKPVIVPQSLARQIDLSMFDFINGKETHLYALPLQTEEKTSGVIVIFQDAAYIKTLLSDILRRTFWRVLVQTVLISIVTLLVVRWSFVGPIARMAEWMKNLRAGESPESFSLPKIDIFAPITKEVTAFARHLFAAKTAAEEEARLRHAAESLWTPERLKEHVKLKLHGKPFFVISNREPYMHMRNGRKIEVVVPPGGLVTALEPLLRACSGTWIAHGSGDADFEVTDERNCVRVPPEDPLYTLRRVVLTKEEENGYYYGFANEGLWPLCHIAHTRPVFRAEDWDYYKQANQKFAETTLQELEGMEDPCILIQDYHFALLPRLIKEKRSDARIAIFWHIPWPNPEAFGICPWQRELIYGMLGADLVGFHIQFHCNNFLDTVDRTMESRIDWERFAVNKGRHTTIVKPFPISVAFPDAFQDVGSSLESLKADRATVLKELGVKAKYIGAGVERMDYTKGVLERFRAVERFLEKYPQYQGDFVFVQLGAPSRTHIKRYHDFLAEVEAEVERINWKFKSKDYRPIVFFKKHHSHKEILPFYKVTDMCMVTSLHDGMNLVAKEFVASRDDEGGVLILSRFTGASRELRDALIVNPYNIEQMADAIHYALEMDVEEKNSRMRRMREVVKENNIYRWAGNLITELTQVRLDVKSPVTAKGA